MVEDKRRVACIFGLVAAIATLGEREGARCAANQWQQASRMSSSNNGNVRMAEVDLRDQGLLHGLLDDYR